MTHRISGDTLPSSDTVAMTPTVQPAAAGTQRYRERDRLTERGVASVTDREDMPSTREMPGDAQELSDELPDSRNAGQSSVRPPKRWKTAHGC
jgi:hypothetical protein